MRLPLDTSEMTFHVVSRPEPVHDPVTGLARTTRQGRPLFMVQLVASWRGTAGVIAVEVTREPSAGVRPGALVTVPGLAAFSWAVGNCSGLVFRAERIELAGGKTEAGTAP
ncbi:MAG TPA: hypothetical protein VFA45_24380 [Actinomycetes bacterium]|jgi:hypothetical protein|nr:hypothetical protein [Actinomycetes bacterium]